MPNEPNRLPIEAVIYNNRLEVEATGEQRFLRDHGLLESAMARSRSFFVFGEEDIVVLAVVLMTGIAQAHAFEQGNKRAAFEAMWRFLRINGYGLAVTDSQPWADAVIEMVEHRTTEQDFVRAIRPFVVAVD